MNPISFSHQSYSNDVVVSALPNDCRGVTNVSYATFYYMFVLGFRGSDNVCVCRYLGLTSIKNGLGFACKLYLEGKAVSLLFSTLL
jgi:hypothetical protein